MLSDRLCIPFPPPERMWAAMACRTHGCCASEMGRVGYMVGCSHHRHRATRKVDSWLPHSLGLYSLSRLPGGLPIREEQTQISRTVRSENLVVEKLHISSGCSRHQTKWSIPLLFASLIHINLVDEHPERQLLKPDISHQPRPKRTMAGNTNPKADRLSVPERSRPDARGNPEDALSLQVDVDGTSNRYANTQACLG